MSSVLVSVIITTKNEEKNIEMCLKSIKFQSYNNIEIIVVDNQSSDKTKEIAAKFTDLIYDKGPERSAQRNYGVSVSHGEYILYLDSDMILAPFVIESCVDEFKKSSSVVGLYIPEIIMGNGLFCKTRRFERSFYNATPIDAIRFVKNDIFIKADGFDESFSGPEDWDFNRKVSKLGELKLLGGYKVLSEEKGVKEWKKNGFSKEIITFLISNGIKSNDLNNKYNNVIFHNETNITLSKYFGKKNYYMKGFDIYINKWGKNDIIVKKQFGLYYRYIGVFIENGKWRKLVRHPLLTVSVYFLKGAVGVVYVWHKLYKFIK
ncbi:MAG: glycosyltransferase [Candidatus Acididesulfobacter guangdongensis]|uniref:Glycosyltransferase n=1 Tax=Acididesulfobacter guangdongensis TaxID=2597225 RepID=A0A519BHW4_ACIG2|nr:MAG: glycosyltransferase [Candidatus Acididesulfobacter guangdongensis]